MFEDMSDTPEQDKEELLDALPLFSVEESDNEDDLVVKNLPSELPLVALKNIVLFPGVIIPITIGRDKSIRAINEAYEKDKILAVTTQKKIEIEHPTPNDLYQVGTLARILKLLKMPDGTMTAILQGRQRIQIDQVTQEIPSFRAAVSTRMHEVAANRVEFDAIVASIKEQGEKIVKLSPTIPSDAIMVLKNIQNPFFLVNFVAANLNQTIKGKQELLEIDNMVEKGESVLRRMNNELQLLELKEKIDTKVRSDIEKQQKDYFLNQQLKTIQEELGQNPQQQEVAELEAKAAKKQWSKVVQERFEKDIKKLKRMNPMMADYSIMLNYLELLVELPWETYSEDDFDLENAEQVLGKDHFGLEKVKDRILEYLAVLKLRQDMKAPIICLVGPPGVGKTSLGKSVAEALGRKYIRMSLGGLHDEAELRGHRKTYIGAMPGRLIQSIKKAETSNPVFILDEIDKIGRSHKGDPSSALLEILDPEQNTTFYDNYLELEYDLSKVLFIATANSLNTIQPALLDRMEIIQVSGYSIEEKTEIAKRHLIPKQKVENGLKEEEIELLEETIVKIAQDYTRESGVRSLNRELGHLMRVIAKKVAKKEVYDTTIQPEQLKDLLGKPPLRNDVYEEDNIPGVAVGLAWTSVGGDILFVETSLSKGKGKLILTGNLGDVMKESATTALSFIRSNADKIGIDVEKFDKTDLHIHVPAGAIPKDGPSAGITMLSAICSAFTGKPLKPFLAMTGEITLRGKVLPVGGIKEKVLAAKRAGIKEIMMCADNQRDVEEINADYIKGMSFHYVRRMNEVLEIALS